MNNLSPVLVTGGAGFIGSNFVLDWLSAVGSPLVNLDKITYAGNPQNLIGAEKYSGYSFERGDICDAGLVHRILNHYQPRAVVHLAAESHVDRSLLGPGDFVQTNVQGTFCLLDCVRAYFERLSPAARARFRFVHVSTDEVYGTLSPDAPPFSESTAYAPNSPYAASKAASDFLVRSYVHSYGFPAITTNCSNNYGPFQFPEKLLPLMIANALAGKPLPVYGDGRQVRDWLYVGDHCAALRLVLDRGRVGETYNIGGRNEQTNLDTIRMLCALLDELLPESPHRPHEGLIRFVADRPGHDRRYAIDSTKIERELGWRPAESFSSGLRRTVQWYLANRDWMEQVMSGAYQHWIDRNYAARGAAAQ